MSPPQSWESILEPLGDGAWDSATELASMIADEMYPDVLTDRVRFLGAAATVVALVKDPDWQRCLKAIIAAQESA